MGEIRKISGKEDKLILSESSNLMIDLETLGVEEDAYILSIGVCQFSLEEGYMEHMIADEWVIGLQDQGRNIDPTTLKWWLRQPAEAFDKSFKTEYTLEEALVNLKKTIKSVCLSSEQGQFNLWCNGASFDFAILKNAYKQLGIDIPWVYYQENCMRSLKALFSDKDFAAICSITEDRLKTKNIACIAHTALSDAHWQAEWVTSAIKYMCK